jgi:hypothetical protein
MGHHARKPVALPDEYDATADTDFGGFWGLPAD